MRKLIRSTPKHVATRQGSAAVEFALIAPVFVTLIMGSIQTAYNIDTTSKMYSAIRQSGRLASMDNSGKLLSGQTANAKVILDIKNALKAEGLPGDQMIVTITHANGASAGTPFDLTDPSNDLKYFRISVTVPFSAVNTDNFLPDADNNLTTCIVFRKGRTSLIN